MKRKFAMMVLVATMTASMMTGCGAKSATCSFMRTLLATLSISGTLKLMPGFHVVQYLPKRSITQALPCGTMLMHIARIHKISTISIRINNIVPPLPLYYKETTMKRLSSVLIVLTKEDKCTNKIIVKSICKKRMRNCENSFTHLLQGTLVLEQICCKGV